MNQARAYPARSVAALVVFGWLVFASSSLGQAPSPWRVYRASDGLRESFSTALTLGPKGVLWVKHAQVDAVSWLDGYSVGSIPSPDATSSRVFGSRAGQQWALSAEGVMRFQRDQWQLFPIPEVGAESKTNLLRFFRQLSLLPTERNRCLILLPDRLLEFDAASNRISVLRSADSGRLGRFLEIIEAGDRGLWVACELGLARVPGPWKRTSQELAWQEFELPADLRLRNVQRPFEDATGGITATADPADGGLRPILMFAGGRWEAVQVPGENVRLAWRGAGQELWIQSGNGLFRVTPGRTPMTEREDFLAAQYFDLAVSGQGAFWLATSQGVARYAPLAWRKPATARDLTGLVHGITQDESGALWLGSPAGLVRAEGDRWQVHPWPADFEPVFLSTDLILPVRQSLLVSAGEQVLRFDLATRRFTRLPPAAGQIHGLLGAAPDGGAFVWVADSQKAPGGGRLQVFDGAGYRDFARLPVDARLGTRLNFASVLTNGDLWIGGSSGVARYRDQAWQIFGRAEGFTGNGALCLLELDENQVWVGSLDRVLQFNGRSWTVQHAGIDRANALMKARDGSVWLASNAGLYRYLYESWVSQSEEEGLPSDSVYEVFEDRDGGLWAGTTRGVSRYESGVDRDPPKTFFNPAGASARPFADGTGAISFHGRDKWQYTAAERLVFSHRLDDGSWSAFTAETSVNFSGLAPGEHRLDVRAMDRNWNVELVPAGFDFEIVVPWYREPRVFSVGLLGLGAALFFAALAVNRHRRLVRSYAEVERIVEQRTRELERANQELLHSQKMKALGTLAAGVAHDFNSILSIIKGSAQIIEANLGDREKIRTRVDRIKTVVEQGAGVVKALLGFSRLPQDDARPCRAGEILDATLLLLGDEFRHKVRVRREVAPQLPEIQRGRDLLQQMLLNLMLNAADAMQERGEIALRAEVCETLPPSMVLVPQPAPRYVCLSVQDFGAGIPAENLPRIFEPFFTTKAFSTRHGTGLGLTMVYEFARELGCGLAVESTLGAGSRFTIFVPVNGAAG